MSMCKSIFKAVKWIMLKRAMRIKELLYETAQFSVYKGIRSQDDDKSIILKLSRFEHPTSKMLTMLQHEYQILKQLNLPHVIHVLDLIHHHNKLILVYEEVKGVRLREFLNQRPLSMNIFFKVAVQLVGSNSGDLHLHHIIYKNLNPDNILIDPRVF